LIFKKSLTMNFQKSWDIDFQKFLDCCSYRYSYE